MHWYDEVAERKFKAEQAEKLRQGLLAGFILLGTLDDSTPQDGVSYLDLAEEMLAMTDANDGSFRQWAYTQALRFAETNEVLVNENHLHQAAMESLQA
jgi:hypothetical protein